MLCVAQRGNRSIAIPIYIVIPAVDREWIVNATPRPFYRVEKSSVRTSGVYMGLRNSQDTYGEEKITCPTGVQTPVHPARGESP